MTSESERAWDVQFLANRLHRSITVGDVKEAITQAVRATWEEAAKIADNWPAECLSDPETNCGPGLAEEFEKRAAALRREEKDKP